MTTNELKSQYAAPAGIVFDRSDLDQTQDEILREGTFVISNDSVKKAISGSSTCSRKTLWECNELKSECAWMNGACKLLPAEPEELTFYQRSKLNYGGFYMPMNTPALISKLGIKDRRNTKHQKSSSHKKTKKKHSKGKQHGVRNKLPEVHGATALNNVGKLLKSNKKQSKKKPSKKKKKHSKKKKKNTKTKKSKKSSRKKHSSHKKNK